MNSSSLQSPSFQASSIPSMIAPFIVPALLSRVKFRWIVYGAVAYYGIKLLNERGMLPAQASNVLDTVNNGISQGIDMAKEKIGFSGEQSSQGSSSSKSEGQSASTSSQGSKGASSSTTSSTSKSGSAPNVGGIH